MDDLANLLGCVQMQRWEDAWAEFEHLRKQGMPSVRGLLLGSHAAFGRRQYRDAQHLAEKALTDWSRADGYKLLGQIKFHRGFVARFVGDTHIALMMFQEFLAEVHKLYPEHAMGEGKAQYYLSLTLWDRREYQAAVEAAKAAVACFRRDDLPDLLRAALQLLAWQQCTLRDVAQARASLAEAEPLCKTALAYVHQVIGKAYLAAVMNDYPRSAELCEEVFRMAARNEPAAGVEEQAQAAWVAGTVACEQGHMESAFALSNVALTLATESSNSRLMNDASQLRRAVLQKMAATAGKD